MKARQIAPALGSVYAVDMLGQLRHIERDEHGFWGTWQTTDAMASRVVHAGDVIARIGVDGRVSARTRAPEHPWETWELEATDLAATRLPEGAPVLFAADGERRAWYGWKPTPPEPWIAWETLDGPIEGLSASVIPGGGLVVFGIRDGAAHHRWQDRLFSTWHGWTALDRPAAPLTALAVSTIVKGGLALVAVGADQVLYHSWQEKPFDRWRDWVALGGGIGSVSLTKSPGGGLAVFAIGTDQAVRYRCQMKPFGDWGEWIELGGTARSIAAQPSYTNGLEVFTIGLDDEIYHTWCDRLETPWAAWTLLDVERLPYRPVGHGDLR